MGKRWFGDGGGPQDMGFCPSSQLQRTGRRQLLQIHGEFYSGRERGQQQLPFGTLLK
ncbi:UNVERIFIED_CONTAM: hypothetical protein Slati_3843300 [Sesamum latifolium]|uniref:Uncharacterized protein n=1 Tax=Sesamum latifolium TaxID=2727402 RepID=A0AAW2TKZ7_9LAMI